MVGPCSEIEARRGRIRDRAEVAADCQGGDAADTVTRRDLTPPGQIMSGTVTGRNDRAQGEVVSRHDACYESGWGTVLSHAHVETLAGRPRAEETSHVRAPGERQSDRRGSGVVMSRGAARAATQAAARAVAREAAGAVRQ
jgi:hypothetical protein